MAVESAPRDAGDFGLDFNIAVQFVDVGREAGLHTLSVWGDPNHKRYIIEAKGNGIAFFDYDQDGWLDIYLTNGTLLDETWPPGQAPTSHLFKNTATAPSLT